VNDAALNSASEGAKLRSLLAGLTLDLELFQLRLALERSYSPDQPRKPAGHPAGGRRMREADIAPAKLNYLQVAETWQEYIQANCRGSIYREFPSQFLNMDTSDLKSAAKAKDPAARKAHKLLFDLRFKK
jgi:hypothetical protein